MMNVANTIKDQIGNKALYMLGASALVGSEDSLQFSIKGCRTINKIRIVLTPADTYTVQFWKMGRLANMKLVREVEEVYCDQLHGVIESHTGLYTSL